MNGLWGPWILCPTLMAAALSGCALDPIRSQPPWNPEAVYQQRWAMGPVCIAFSGGGIRSSAFSIGGMQGLQDAGLLQKADLLTATSGGAYAASWLYTATRSRGLSLEDALESDSKEQARLARRAEYFVDRAGSGTIGVLGAATAFIENSYNPMQCEKNSPSLLTLGSSYGYQLDIAGMFHDSKQPNFVDITQPLREPKLPMLVIGVTTTPGHQPTCDGNIDEQLFPGEISHEGLRSGSTVIRADISTWKVMEVVASAGSALDVTPAQSDGFSLCRLGKNFRPLTGSATCTPDHEKSPVTYITDGGFTDNLALLPAIQRQCKVIVSFDATHDPTFTFEDLKQREKELSVLGVNLGEIRESIAGEGAGEVFVADKAKSAVSIQTTSAGLTFAYVKLSIPSSRAEAVPAIVARTHDYSSVRFSSEAGCRYAGLKKRCRFPMEATVRQTMYASEFMAYRDLGRWIVRSELLPGLLRAGATTSGVEATELSSAASDDVKR